MGDALKKGMENIKLMVMLYDKGKSGKFIQEVLKNKGERYTVKQIMDSIKMDKRVNALG